MNAKKAAAVLIAAALLTSNAGYALSANAYSSDVQPSAAAAVTEISRDTTSDGMFEYKTLSDGTISLTKFNDPGVGVTFSIPSEIDGKKVTAIGSECFQGAKLTTLELPDSITAIEHRAFYNCALLSSVKLPARLESIGGNSFGNCKVLTSITIPKTLTKAGSDWGDGPFNGCTALKDVTLEAGLKTIPSYLFQTCPGITEINIPNSVTTIENSAFSVSVPACSSAPAS